MRKAINDYLESCMLGIRDVMCVVAGVMLCLAVYDAVYTAIGTLRDAVVKQKQKLADKDKKIRRGYSSIPVRDDWE